MRHQDQTAMASDSDPLTGFLSVSATKGIRIFYQVDGPLDDSRPIVLLSNSLAASTELWNDLVRRLRNDTTVIRYDARFHGKSPLSTDNAFDYHKGHSLDDLAQDVIKLLDHLQVTRVSLAIGLSIGAGVVLLAAAKQPNRFGHVLVVGTKATAPANADAAYDARIAYGKQHGTRALGQQSVQRWFPPSWIEANPTATAEVEDIVGRQSIEGFTANAAALRHLDLWPVAQEIGQRGDGSRFTFVAGEHDADIPEDSRQLAETTGSDVIIVPASGHIVNIQQPEKFCEIVRQALSKGESAT